MLFPNTQRNSMLSSRWNQPPCVNIDVSTVQYFGAAPTMQTIPGASETPLPGGTLCTISPGIRPSWQTERASGPAAPAPWTRTNTRAFATMIATVMTAGRSVGFSSLLGVCLNGSESGHDACPCDPQHL